jgi:hypothetical protein
MNYSLFLLKLILAPVIVATATLIARRWGQHIGGIIVGLPMTSAPVSIFFAIEQGRTFAAGAALGAMMGVIPVTVFCTAYVLGARRLPLRMEQKMGWYLSPLVAIFCYLAAVWPLSRVAPPLALVVVLVPLALLAGLWIIGRGAQVTEHFPAPWWDLPLRMGIATALLLVITGAASVLGPTWSGLLSPFPIFTFVMATFAYRMGGQAAAHHLIRGVLTGLFSYLTFFLVVALLVERTGLLVTYPLAILAALGINSLSLARVVWKRRLAGARI